MKKFYLLWMVLCAPLFCYPQTEIFINEIHYENIGGDSNEGIEIAGPAGADLTGWKLVFYNGSGGVEYATFNLSGILPNLENNRGTLWFNKSNIQNDMEGIALIDPLSNVIQFLSYEGAFMATDGIATGLTSTNIAVSESGSTASGDSLQLSGTGTYYGDFSWAIAATSTPNLINNNQTFSYTPYVLVNSSVPTLKYEFGLGPSEEETVIVEGRNLSNTIVLNAPANFEISKTSGTGWTSSIVFPPVVNIVGPTTIYVQLKSMLSVGSYNENIVVSSIDAPGNTVALSGKVNPVSTNSLVITGVFDGPLPGGAPKGVELYVINDIPDLSVYGLGSVANGNGASGEDFTFPDDSVTAGEYIYVSLSISQFNVFFWFDPNYTHISMNINGDDAIELFENGQVFDVFGDINSDGTGQPWEYLDGWAYRNTVGPSSTFLESEWNYSGVGALVGETTNASASTPFPIGTYNSAVLSVIKNEIEDFAMYPNPVSNGKLYMTSRGRNDKNIEIYSWLGQQVYNKKIQSKETVNVSNLNRGIYIVKIEEEGKIATRKLIVN